MKLRKYAVAVAAAALTVIAIPVALTAAPAYAGSGNQWSYETGGHAYVNGWGGGPRVNVYTSSGAVNNDFTLVYNYNGHAYQLQFTSGSGQYNGLCVGDYGNNPGDASTGLVPCGPNGGEGWGSLFDLTDPAGCGTAVAYVFHDHHWNNQLGPPNNYVNGSHWYLNTPQQNCIYLHPPA